MVLFQEVGMKCVIQRVSSACVRVNNRITGKINHGLLLLLCIEQGDTLDRIIHWAHRIPLLRVFNDEQKKMNLSLQDVSGAVLVVSQFTLAANLNEKGRRPSFTRAEKPERANMLIQQFVEAMRAGGIHVETGEFGAMMDVELINDGPVTFIIDEPGTSPEDETLSSGLPAWG